MVAKSKSSAAAAAGNSKSKKVEEKPHVAKESKMLPVVEMVVSGALAAWFAWSCGWTEERSFAGTVDELVNPAFPALPRQFCIVIHWVFTLISGCACIATLIGPVPVLGNRTVFMVGTKLMTVATACQCLVRVLAMGFNTTQLAPRLALIVALKGAARLSKISQGPSLFLTWFVSVRPWTFPAALAPLLVTAAVVNWLGLELSSVPHVTELIFSLVAVQASANQINSIADLWNGVDNVETAADRSIVDGHMSMRTMIASAASLFGLFVALLVRCGMMVPPEYKLSLTVLATVGGLAAFIYTAGPLPFKYIGLGDLLIFITFGPMTTYYFLLCLTNPDQSTPIFGEIFLFTLPILLLVVAILNSNNIRDMEEDKAMGVNTLASMLGPKLSRVYFATLQVAPHFITAWLMDKYNCPGLLLTFLVIPRSLWQIYRVCIRNISALRGPARKSVVKETSDTVLIYGLATAMGLACSPRGQPVNVVGVAVSMAVMAFFYATLQ
ncbi:UbiA prenyltransferase domain-containing protein 1 [Perkinsus olseni]|uniref:UbiA prenyltransferase domain-containing protein 1 n=1 Tax=Perkinsus olseni TaxID=32597 RepID=A0A7J6MIB1_PEROL|nr:UbiA prenyltransferase domain-containing protein 1 [Perkinsus olseni]